MAKISDTFGYGEKIKKEAPPMKKPLTTEPKTKKKIQTGSKSKVENKPSTQKPKPPAGGVKQWDFNNPAASSLNSVTKKSSNQLGKAYISI